MKAPGVALCCRPAVGGIYCTTGQPTPPAWPLMPKGLRGGKSTSALENEFPLQMAVTITLSEFLNTSNKKKSLLYGDYSYFSIAGIMKDTGLPLGALKFKN